MTNEELIAYLTASFPESEVILGPQYLEMTVSEAHYHSVAVKLKESKDSAFDYLFCLSGVDYAENMGVVCHLESIKHRHVMVLKVRTTDRITPSLDTISDIWITAKYHEREIYDLLGIKFNNHTDMRRLFLEDGWGFPLRKDYVDEIRIVER